MRHALPNNVALRVKGIGVRCGSSFMWAFARLFTLGGLGAYNSRCCYDGRRRKLRANE